MFRGVVEGTALFGPANLTSSTRTLLPGLQCTGSEASLGECPIDPAAVDAANDPTAPPQGGASMLCEDAEFDVRLRGGTHVSEGRVGE